MNSRQSWNFHGVPIGVRTGAAAVGDLLAPRLRRFPSADGCAPAIWFQYDVAPDGRVDRGIPPAARSVYEATGGEVRYDDATDRLFLHYPDRLHSVADLTTGEVDTVLATGDWDDCWVAAHPFFTLALLEQLKRFGLFGLHAALLAQRDAAVLIAGTSGAGKSTLTLALLRAGWAFGGDDMCFLAPGDGGLRVLSFPDELDVTDGTIDFFSELAPLRTRRSRPGARKWPLLPEESYAVDFIRSCTPGAILFPRISNDERSRFEIMDAGAALMELVPNVLLTQARRSQQHLDALADLVRRSRCWRLHTGRDFEDLPGRCAELLPAAETRE